MIVVESATIARTIMRQVKDKEAHKRATTLVAQNRALPPHLRKREKAIIDTINEEFKNSVNVATVQRYVRNDMQGKSPLRRGAANRIALATPPPGYRAGFCSRQQAL
jgi:ABC-type Fe3+/spermidine/putrescine transport system ATPase subunit